jgi:DNA-binding transcriptional regulator YhcF (GntR family)/DNA-binding LacI/PurR family transcriptional regulator
LDAKSSHALVAKSQQPAYRRIFEGLRVQIVNGKMAPGTQLPSTRDLATTWKSNPFTIHTALAALTKEGWLDRRHGSGTFIADPKSRFHCVGIYHSVDFTGQTAYTRSLHFSLIQGFEKLKKNTQVFMDPRPDHEQKKLLPALADAILQRRIQCLVAPVLNAFNQKSLLSLAMPTAFACHIASPRRAELDQASMARESLRRLKTQGCRSVGLISNVSHGSDSSPDFYDHWRHAAREEGLLLREEWISRPRGLISDLELYGYEQFKSLWKMRRKPDSLVVFPDTAVRGVIVALLDIGRPAVTKQMKFVFHRNAHIPLLCPLPVTWMIADEEAVAQALIELIQKQFRREKVSPVLIPLSFKDDFSR